MRYLLILLLAGCGGGGDESAADNHGHGFQYDAITASGIRERGGDPAYFETAWTEVQACTGLSGPAPFVVVVPEGSLGNDQNGKAIIGVYMSDPSLILIYASLPKVVRHEMIHDLLAFNFHTPDAATDHMQYAALFAKCE